jgi:RNA polymerase sigma-70 factor (ECF subfamily)
VESDERLMAQYQAGEAAAFASLYRRHWKRVVRFFERRGHEGPEGAQQAWFRVVCARGQYRTSMPFLPWLLGICRNLLRDGQRRARSRAAAATLLRASDEGHLPMEQVAARLVTAHALQAVGPQLRALLAAHHGEARSFRELSAQLGVPIGTLKVRAHRAYRAMRSHCEAASAQ